MNNMTLAVVRNIAYSQINKINKNIKEIVEVDNSLLTSIDINMKNAINKIINNYKLKNQDWKYNKEKNTMKKILEYMTIIMASVGTISMFSAVGAIETDQYLLAVSATILGITSYMLALYSQTLYSEEK